MRKVTYLLKRPLALFRADFTSIIRDPMLRLFFIMPLFIPLIFRIVVTIGSRLLMERLGFDLSPYYPLIQSIVILMAPFIMGTAIGFVLLEERDENVLSFIAVTPLGKRGQLFYKILLSVLLSFICTYLSLFISGLMEPRPFKLLLVALMAALEAPLIALFMTAFAANKVEGLVMAKATGILMLGPLLAYFIPQPWNKLALLFPTTWVAKAFQAGYGPLPPFLFYGACGLLVHLIVVLLFLKIYESRAE